MLPNRRTITLFLSSSLFFCCYGMQQEETCCICQDLITKNTPVVWLPCAHRLHQTCYDKLIKYDNKCPLCRAVFLQNNKHEMIFVYDDTASMYLPVNQHDTSTTDCITQVGVLMGNCSTVIAALLRKFSNR